MELPEDIEVPDPSFTFVLAHLVSHVFCVEPEVDPDGEAPEALQDFDPLDSLSRFHEGTGVALKYVQQTYSQMRSIFF